MKTIWQGKTKTGGHGCGCDSTPLSRDVTGRPTRQGRGSGQVWGDNLELGQAQEMAERPRTTKEAAARTPLEGAARGRHGGTRKRRDGVRTQGRGEAAARPQLTRHWAVHSWGDRTGTRKGHRAGPK